MKRIKCPFCEFDIAVVDGYSMMNATEKVMIHATEEHKGQGIWSPRPGVVLDMSTPKDHQSLKVMVPTMLQSLMLTVSVTKQDRAVAYNLLGVTGHDLLMAGYDFSISANEYDPDEPLPMIRDELLVHDDLTMNRVRTTIINAIIDEQLVHKPSKMADEIINALLNAGILFRERP